MRFPWIIKERAVALLRGGFYPHEVHSNLEVEFDLDEFQLEDLAKLIDITARQLNGEQNEDTRQQSTAVAAKKSQQSHYGSREEQRASKQ